VSGVRIGCLTALQQNVESHCRAGALSYLDECPNGQVDDQVSYKLCCIGLPGSNWYMKPHFTACDMSVEAFFQEWFCLRQWQYTERSGRWFQREPYSCFSVIWLSMSYPSNTHASVSAIKLLAWPLMLELALT
jgi:hypothetical protein